MKHIGAIGEYINSNDISYNTDNMRSERKKY